MRCRTFVTPTLWPCLVNELAPRVAVLRRLTGGCSPGAFFEEGRISLVLEYMDRGKSCTTLSPPACPLDARC